jgi:hypothetical protein
MLDGLDSRTHFATLVSPILPTCFRPYVKTKQLSRVAMGAAWQPTFNPKPFDSEAAEQFLGHIAGFGKYDPQTPPPDHWVYTDTIFSMGDSQPGGDGLPYSAWRHTGVRGPRVLGNVDRELRRGDLPPSHFNQSTTVFTPKGSLPHDPVEIIREPLQTRPLSLKNSDNKLIVSDIHIYIYIYV